MKKLKTKLKFKISLKSKKSKIVLGLLVLVIIATGGYFGFKAYSYNNYTEYLKYLNASRYDSDNAQESVYKELNNFSSNIKEIASAEDLEKVLDLIDDSYRIIDQQVSDLKEYCSSNQKIETKKSEHLSGIKIALIDQSDRDNLNKLLELIDSYQSADDAECDNLEGFKEVAKFTLEAYKASIYLSLATTSNYEDTESINKLAKYSDGSYTIGEKDQIKELYGKSMVAFMETTFDVYKLVFEQYQAAMDGDNDLSIQKYDEYLVAASKIDSLSSKSDDEYKDIQKDSYSKSLKQSKEIFIAIDSINTKMKVPNYSQAAWGSSVLLNAIEQYQLYNNDKYPDCSDTKCLINKLSEKRYLDGVDISPDNIEYISKGGDSYKFTYKNTATNDQIEIEKISQE